MSGTNKKFNLSCGHCSYTTFILTFILTSYSLYTRYANFDFDQGLIFTECCFWLWKKFLGSKSLLARFPTPKKKFPSKISHSLPLVEIPLPLNAISITMSSSFQIQNIWHNKCCIYSLSYPVVLNILIDRSSN